MDNTDSLHNKTCMPLLIGYVKSKSKLPTYRPVDFLQQLFSCCDVPETKLEVIIIIFFSGDAGRQINACVVMATNLIEFIYYYYFFL